MESLVKEEKHNVLAARPRDNKDGKQRISDPLTWQGDFFLCKIELHILLPKKFKITCDFLDPKLVPSFLVSKFKLILRKSIPIVGEPHKYKKKWNILTGRKLYFYSISLD